MFRYDGKNAKKFLKDPEMKNRGRIDLVEMLENWWKLKVNERL